MSKIPDLSFWKLWNISFGFFGVQIAYALQSANISRIFSTLGADPHDLSYFWILPPLAGIIVQPIIGAMSDRTWTRFGRRIPYLFVGALMAVAVMCLLPNAGSFGMSVSAAMIFGLISLMFLDTSINMAMQPFKMMVGDMVNEKQKGLAYSIQSFLCNAGSLAGYLFPFIFAAIGISNIAPKGVIPDSVIYSFYIGAIILILCVIYTSAKVKEYPPKLYAEYHGIKEEKKEEKETEKHENVDRKQTINLTEESLNTKYIIADCCHPIPGDDVLGYYDDDKHIVIHKRSCPTANTLKSSHGDRILAAKWETHKQLYFAVPIQIKGIDGMGVLHKITAIIYQQLNANIQKINIESNNGIFEGTFWINVHDVEDVKTICNNLKKIENIKAIARIG